MRRVCGTPVLVLVDSHRRKLVCRLRGWPTRMPAGAADVETRRGTSVVAGVLGRGPFPARRRGLSLLACFTLVEVARLATCGEQFRRACRAGMRCGCWKAHRAAGRRRGRPRVVSTMPPGSPVVCILVGPTQCASTLRAQSASPWRAPYSLMRASVRCTGDDGVSVEPTPATIVMPSRFSPHREVSSAERQVLRRVPRRFRIRRWSRPRRSHTEPLASRWVQ